MIMHHIALFTLCIALFNGDHFFAYAGRSRGADIGNSSGASLRSVRRTTSVKL
jgi:hypothetical protein